MLTMIRTLICCTLLALSVPAYGQFQGFNYIPLEFEDLDPIWSHVVVDSSIIGDASIDSFYRYDGYNHVSGSRDVEKMRLIEGDYLYFINRTIYDGDFSGAIIDKIDLETGELIWQSSFDLRTLEKREYVQRATIENNQLVLYCIVVCTEFPSLFFGEAVGHLKIRRYSLDTGRLIGIEEADPNDSLTATLKVGMNGNVVMRKIESSNGYEVITRDRSPTGPILHIDTIDRRGRYVNLTDTLFSNIRVDWKESYLDDSFNFARDSQNNLIWFMHFFARPDAIQEDFVEVRQYYKDSIVTFDLDLSELPGLTSVSIRNISDEEILFQVSDEDDYFGFLFLDRFTGEQKLFFHPYQSFRSRREYIFRDSSGSFLYSEDRTIDDEVFTEIYQYDRDTITYLTGFKMIDEDFAAYPDDLYPLADGNYLLELIYKPPAFFDGHTALIKLSPEQLGLTTSTSDIAVNNKDFVAYPNPFVEVLSFSLDENSLVSIYDIFGRLVYTKKLIKGVHRIRPDLALGQYVLSVNSKTSSSSLVILKVD